MSWDGWSSSQRPHLHVTLHCPHRSVDICCIGNLRASTHSPSDSYSSPPWTCSSQAQRLPGSTPGDQCASCSWACKRSNNREGSHRFVTLLPGHTSLDHDECHDCHRPNTMERFSTCLGICPAIAVPSEDHSWMSNHLDKMSRPRWWWTSHLSVPPSFGSSASQSLAGKLPWARCHEPGNPNPNLPPPRRNLFVLLEQHARHVRKHQGRTAGFHHILWVQVLKMPVPYPPPRRCTYCLVGFCDPNRRWIAVLHHHQCMVKFPKGPQLPENGPSHQRSSLGLKPTQSSHLPWQGCALDSTPNCILTRMINTETRKYTKPYKTWTGSSTILPKPSDLVVMQEWTSQERNSDYETSPRQISIWFGTIVIPIWLILAQTLNSVFVLGCYKIAPSCCISTTGS